MKNSYDKFEFLEGWSEQSKHFIIIRRGFPYFNIYYCPAKENIGDAKSANIYWQIILGKIIIEWQKKVEFDKNGKLKYY